MPKWATIRDHADNALVFAFAITLMVIPIMALLTGFFKYMGWPGPASLTQHP